MTTDSVEPTNTDNNAAPANSAPNNTDNQPTPHQQFLEMLPEDLRTEAAFVKFKDNGVAGLAKAYVNLEKLVGADKASILKIPAEETAPEWNDIYNKLGRPEKSADYGVADLVKDVPGIKAETLQKIADKAHARGVSKAALQDIVQTYIEDVKATSVASEEESAAMATKYVDDLKKEWGDAYDQKTTKVLSALKQHATPEFLQMAKDHPYIFDNPAVMKTFDNLIKMRAEDSGKQPGSSSGDARLTPAEAQAEINAMELDPQINKILMDGGDPRRAALLEKRTRLFEQAYGKSA